MDFVERWLGLAPDGGTGTVELAVLMTAGCTALAAVLWHRRRAWFIARLARKSVRS
jgi:hypothetical protein